MKCSITTDTLEAPLIRTLFPDIKAPINYKTGIS